jgi:hypothetical protein
MGLQGIAYAPAAGLNHWLRLVRLPPDPGSSILPRSCHRFCWLQLPLILRFGLLSSLLAPVNGSPLATFTPAWCFSTWWYATRPTIISLLQSDLNYAFTYWEFLFLVHLDQLHCSMFCPLTPSTFASGSQPLPGTAAWSFGTTEWVWPSRVAYTIQPAASVPNFGGSSLSSWFRCIAVCSAEHMRPSYSCLSFSS